MTVPAMACSGCLPSRCGNREVIGQCFAQHRAREFRKFMNTVEANVPDEFDVHMIMDNASIHKTLAVRNWFAKHPRCRGHCTADVELVDQRSPMLLCQSH